eukprot:1791637-Prorocentrum_lima.AAC.1
MDQGLVDETLSSSTRYSAQTRSKEWPTSLEEKNHKSESGKLEAQLIPEREWSKCTKEQVLNQSD